MDLTWTTSIRPLLLERYPGLSASQLDEAHAYAYGGCAIQDLGYYPFGNVFFSELTHYVRSGDFVQALLRNARTPDELAFAIGALSHYVGDSIGHSEATDPAVGDQFPGLRKKYGSSVAYDQAPHAHVRTEFAFDINQIAKRRFAPSAYLRHIGLQVAQDLLDRAFYETYGLEAENILGARRPTVRGYR
ncbi:MAG TPA: zinc dependent phospholipase C family protein, partial [Acidobacteriaceae bacterium]